MHWYLLAILVIPVLLLSALLFEWFRSTRGEKAERELHPLHRISYPIFLTLLYVVIFALGYVFGVSGTANSKGSDSVMASKPIEVTLNVTGLQPSQKSPLIVSVPPGTGAHSEAGGHFLSTLSDLAVRAMDSAREQTADVASLPKAAASEFVKGLSGEAGKELVNAFGELVKAGFGSSKDKAEEKKQFTVLVLRDALRDDAASPQPIFVDCPQNRAVDRVKIAERVLFDPGRSTISDSASQVINRVRDYAREHRDFLVLLTSNTDTMGSSAINRTLSKQRSASVRDRLIHSGGIEPSRIFSAELATESLPIVTGGDRSEPRNRAVTVEVRD
jgi:outer membrane protein OmpA-like peptidoglycan-associated protein